MTYRLISQIARCSSGAVGADMRAMKAVLLAKEKKKMKEEDALPKLGSKSG